MVSPSAGKQATPTLTVLSFCLCGRRTCWLRPRCEFALPTIDGHWFGSHRHDGNELITGIARQNVHLSEFLADYPGDTRQ